MIRLQQGPAPARAVTVPLQPPRSLARQPSAMRRRGAIATAARLLPHTQLAACCSLPATSRSRSSTGGGTVGCARVVGCSATPIRRRDHHQQQHPQHQQHRRGSQLVACSSSRQLTGGAGRSVQVAGIIAAVIALGTLNRVLYRLALVPLADYVFFLAQAQNVAYLVMYFSLLALRYRQGKVTDAMLGQPKRLFILTGCCEAVAQLLMMTGAARLPGALLPLLMQTVLVWNLLFSSIVFGLRPTLLQVAGVLAVLAGVVVATLPPAATSGVAATPVEPLFVGLCAVSFVFPSIATIVKERVFREAAKRLGGGQQLDVLVVNAYCSASQAGFLLLLLPLSCALKGLTLEQLPSYLSAGATCLLGGSPPCGADCQGAPLLPVLYCGVNVAFNVAAMLLVRSCGAVATGLTMSCLVPLTVAAFTLPLPYLAPAALGPHFAAGTCLLMAGLLAFNAPGWAPAVGRVLQSLLPKQPGAKLADG